MDLWLVSRENSSQNVSDSINLDTKVYVYMLNINLKIHKCKMT